MRLSHSLLERVRRDPALFAQQRSTDGGAHPTLSKNRLLQFALFRYHTSRGDVDAALQFFHERFTQRFRTTSRYDELVEAILSYHRSYQERAGNGYAEFRCQARMAFDLGNLTVTGEISRLDLAPNGGYSAIIFSASEEGGRADLRLPLIQSYTARLMGVETSSVEAGYCWILGDSGHDTWSYSPQEIRAAIAEADAIGRALDE